MVLAALDFPPMGDVCAECEPSPVGDVAGAAKSASVVEGSVKGAHLAGLGFPPMGDVC